MAAPYDGQRVSLGGGGSGAVTVHEAAADPHTGYVLESLLDAKGDLYAASADNTPAKVTAGANNTVLVADSAQTAGVKWAPRGSDRKDRSSGDITVNSTSWIALDTNLDITLAAATGDKIEVAVSGVWRDENVHGCLDVATIVSAAPVTYFSTKTGTPAGLGVAGWLGLSTLFFNIGNPIQLTLVGGDISGGNVLLRLQVKTAAATNKLMSASTDLPLTFMAKNLGAG